MRRLPSNLAGNLAQAPVFSKDTGPSTRLSVQTDWNLTPTSSGTGAYPTNNLPIRWWQDDDGSQFASEIEIPNLKHVVTDDHITQSAATIEVQMYNTSTPANGSAGPNANVFGDPGHYAYAHGASSDSSSYFSSSTNSWANVLRENALIRVYQGYGGWWLSLQDAVNEGYLILKGVYLMDSVTVDSQAGLITMTGRSMAKLLVDQYVWPPTISQSRYYNSPGSVYGAGLIYWVTGQNNDTITATPGYGGTSQPKIVGFSWAPNGKGYRLYGTDGGVFDYGSSTFKGSIAGRTLNGAIVDGDGTPTGNGYRMCGSDGGVFDYGDGSFLGSLPGLSITATDVVAIRNTPSGNGYYLVRASGAVYAFGDAVYHGGATPSAPIVDMAVMPSGAGYWLLASNGAVYSFGSIGYYGNASITSPDTAVGIDSSASGNGYWIVSAKGAVFGLGDAVYYGGVNRLTLAAPITRIRRTPTGHGYNLCGADGGVFATGGDATFWGALPGDYTIVRPGTYADYCLDERSEILTRRGWLRYDEVEAGDETLGVDSEGQKAWTKINSVYRNPRNGDMVRFSGPIDALSTPEHRWLTRTDGELSWTTSEDIEAGDFSELVTWFWGDSWPGPSFVKRDDLNILREHYEGVVWCPQTELGSFVARRNGSVYLTGNSDIVKDFALWAGFYLFPHSTGGNTPAGQQPAVYGNIENTGTYNRLGSLNGQVWDKQSVWQVIQKVAGIVSFLARVDDQGAINFQPFNWWNPGNFLDDGTHTTDTPLFVDDVNITSYTQTTTDASMVSEILVGTQDPYMFQGSPPDTAIIRFVPPNISTLHGINKPAMIGIPMNVPVSVQDEEIMAELLAVQCFLAQRQGQLQGIYNPAICVDDQIRIIDRSTGEADVHYVTGVHVEHDLQAGTCLATYTTYWLGNSLTWAVNTSQDTFLAGSEMTGTIYGDNGIVLSEQLVQYLAGTGVITVTQVVGTPTAFPPELGP